MDPFGPEPLRPKGLLAAGLAIRLDEATDARLDQDGDPPLLLRGYPSSSSPAMPLAPSGCDCQQEEGPNWGRGRRAPGPRRGRLARLMQSAYSAAVFTGVDASVRRAAESSSWPTPATVTAGASITRACSRPVMVTGIRLG
jgi:hypothetical protein